MNTKQFEPITLGTDVVVSDPCYTRDTWCMGTLHDLKPGKYIPVLTYSDEGDWGNRVKMLQVVHEDYPTVEYDEKKWIEAIFEVGVDSGQAGIFDNSIYPEGEIGEYGDDTSFYGKCCKATLDPPELVEWYRKLEFKEWRQKDYERLKLKKDIDPEFKAHILLLTEEDLKEDLGPKPESYQGGTIDGKGFVSSSGYGDGGYSCYYIKDGEQIIAICIVFIEESEAEEEDDEDL